MRDVERLEARLAGYGSVLLGYSGGVDSSLLAVAARRTLGPGKMLAVIGTSASYPKEQWRCAVDLARRFDVPVEAIATAELSVPAYRANPTTRCFFCKTELWSKLVPLARARGLAVVVDGTNADDVRPGEHRPGFGAGKQWAVHSPLADLGFTKAMVRDAARELGLPNWRAPSAPCLASRIRYGVAVTAERLRQVEAAEAILRKAGVRGDLRVRHLGGRARIEVGLSELPLVRAAWHALERDLRALGFPIVELDPRGYRRGAMILDTALFTCASSSR